jgi:tetratricopeptide (TPR) repeat protein
MVSKEILFKNIIKIKFIIFLIFPNYSNSSDNQIYFSSYYGSLLAGQIAKYNNDNDIAAKYYGFANKKDPYNENILELSLMSLILSGKIKIALEEIANYDKNVSLENSQIAQLLFFIDSVKKGKYEKALELMKNNENIIITSKVKPIIKAWLSNNFSEAQSSINQFEYKSPGLVMSDLYFLHLGLINILYQNKSSAISIFEKSLENGIEDKLRHLYFYYNIISKENSNKNTLINDFIKRNPEHSFNIYFNKENMQGFKIKNKTDGVSESLFNIAEALYTQRMFDTSIAYSYLSLYLNKKNYINYYLISQNLLMLGKEEKALQVLSKIPLDTYLGWNSYLKLVDLNMNLKRYETAKDYIFKLANYFPNRIDTNYKLGELYHNRKNYKKAISSFSKAISYLNKQEEKSWYLYYSRGMSYERSQNWEKAEKDFLFALKLSPKQPLVLNYLGYTWVDYGMKLNKAEEYIRKAIQLRPKDGYFIDSLGWTYYRQGKYDLAVTELEKAVSLVPNDPIINDHLGDALYRAGYKNEAIYQWNRALLYDPEEELIQNIKFKLKKGL